MDVVCLHLSLFLDIFSVTMPDIGLPASLEVALTALLSENEVSSWKITGEGSNLVVVVRLNSCDNTTGRDSHHAGLHFHKKTPSRLRRDRRRAE